MRPRLAALSLVLVLAACGGGPAAPSRSSSAGPPSAASPSAAPSATGAASSARVDLTGVDACSFLDEKGVQEITGATQPFTTGGGGGSRRCFWGVPRAGHPQYVEIEVSTWAGGLAGYNFSPFNSGTACAIVSVAGVGAEAKGATCPPDPQRKIHLIAWDRGVLLTVLVNEPIRPLAPAELGAIANRVLGEIAAR